VLLAVGNGILMSSPVRLEQKVAVGEPHGERDADELQEEGHEGQRLHTLLDTATRIERHDIFVKLPVTPIARGVTYL
jgi:hypothetical protein